MTTRKSQARTIKVKFISQQYWFLVTQKNDY